MAISETNRAHKVYIRSWLLAKDSEVRGKPAQSGRIYHRRSSLRKTKTTGKATGNHSPWQIRDTRQSFSVVRYVVPPVGPCHLRARHHKTCLFTYFITLLLLGVQSVVMSVSACLSVCPLLYIVHLFVLRGQEPSPAYSGLQRVGRQ